MPGHFGYNNTLLPGKNGPVLNKILTFFCYTVIMSVSEKNRERESPTDLLNENETMVNPRQLPSVFRKTLAIR
jgi:hypothetical protein